MARSEAAPAEFHEVVKEYPIGLFGRSRHRAVDRVSFEVRAGEVVGLAGPNRAGKTTLVKLLLSLCRPTRGQVFRFGQPASRRETLARVGYVHERPAFPGYLSALELLDYYAVMSGIPPRERKRRIPELLHRVGLADRAGEPIGPLSKGMVQRLGLAQALVNDPELLVLDEPYEGLDLDGRGLVGEILGEQRLRGRSVLIVSHVITCMEQHCDRAVVLVAGGVVHQEVLKRSTSPRGTAGPRAGTAGGASGKPYLLSRPLETVLAHYCGTIP